MRICFSESADLAGLDRSCELDTSKLPVEEAADIEALVKRAGVLKSGFTFYKLVIPAAHDIMGYRISVSSDEISYRVGFDDLSVPESARPLLNNLKLRAQQRYS